MIDLTQFVKISADDADINIYVSNAYFQQMIKDGLIVGSSKWGYDTSSNGYTIVSSKLLGIGLTKKDETMLFVSSNDLLNKDPHRIKGDEGNDNETKD